MCVIAVCKKRKLTDKEVELMWQSNPEGAGLAWAEDGQVHYRKGFMKLRDFKRFYGSREFPFPHIAHFRITSAGITSPELTHPFIVSHTSPLQLEYHGPDPVLFHNGTYRQWKEVVGATAIATETEIPGAMNDSRAVAIVTSFIPDMVAHVAADSASKFSVIYPDGKVKMYGRWNESDDIDTSNDYWKSEWRVNAVRSTSESACGVGPTAWNSAYEFGALDDATVEAMVKESSGKGKKKTKKEKKEEKKKARLISKKVIIFKDKPSDPPAGKAYIERNGQRVLVNLPSYMIVKPRYRSPLVHGGIVYGD